MADVHCEECGTQLYRAGDRVAAGSYLRVDDESFQRLQLLSSGVLPASFDGHIAVYRVAAAPCTCERCRSLATDAERSVALMKANSIPPANERAHAVSRKRRPS